MRKILFFIGFSAIALFANAQTVKYVTPNGTGTGTGSWANASNDLQDVINNASAGDSIFVSALRTPTIHHFLLKTFLFSAFAVEKNIVPLQQSLIFVRN